MLPSNGLALTKAVGILEACLTAVIGLIGRSDCTCYAACGLQNKRNLRTQKGRLQQILQEGLLAEVNVTLPTARRETQVVIEHLTDAADFAERNGQHREEYGARLAEARALLEQLIQEITHQRQNDTRIEAKRHRTKRPFAPGYQICVRIRHVERGMPEPVRSRRRRHSFVSYCY